MTEASIVAIILGVLGLLGGGGYWGWRQYKKEAPVKQREADLAVAEKSQQMALALADDLREDYTRLRADLDAERGERQTLAGRLDSLENHIREQDRTIRKLRTAVGLYAASWDQLDREWSTLRQRESPPTRPTVVLD